MKKINIYTIMTFAVLLFAFAACDKDEHELGELTTPSGLNLSYEIVGVSDDFPYGDGSGEVIFTATASNAITFNFDFGDGRGIQIAPDGIISYPFATNGVNIYNVTVTAVGTGGTTSTKIESVEVYSSFEDPDALEFLTGGSSKTWYWASDQPGHAGMGPTSDDYGNLEFTWAAWWQIGAWDTDKACMYDAEFVFTKTENGLNFEQTAGPAFIPGTYAGDIGVDGDICHNTDVVPDLYGVKTVTFSPSSSNASLAADNYRGTTMTLSDNGCMCWWVGRSEYDIIDITETTLTVRIYEDETNTWYHTFVSEKPVQ